MDRAQKHEFVSSLHDVFSNTGVIVVAHYAGLSVADMTDLRRQMREAGGHVKVAKNRLAKIALHVDHHEGSARRIKAVFKWKRINNDHACCPAIAWPIVARSVSPIGD